MKNTDNTKPSDRMRLAILERALREIALELDISDDGKGPPFWAPKQIAEQALIEAGIWQETSFDSEELDR